MADHAIPFSDHGREQATRAGRAFANLIDINRTSLLVSGAVSTAAPGRLQIWLRPTRALERLGALRFGAKVAQKLRDLATGHQDSLSSGELKLLSQWLTERACRGRFLIRHNMFPNFITLNSKLLSQRVAICQRLANIIVAILVTSMLIHNRAKAAESNLIKTKCYTTESPVGEVCLYEDIRATGKNRNQYIDNCADGPSKDPKLLNQSELRVYDSNKNETDRRKIGSIVSIELAKTKIYNTKTYYTSTPNPNETFGACSVYSQGTKQYFFWVRDGKILYIPIINDRVISFRQNLRNNWRLLPDGLIEGKTELLVSSGNSSIVTRYRRYTLINNKWSVIERSTPDWVEFEGELDERDFPPRKDN